MSHEGLIREIGSSGVRASAVGLGTWAIGGWMWGGTDQGRSIAAIQASIDEGISLIDTAPAYGQGLAEEIVGKAIKGRREKVVLATKCGLVWHTTKGNHFFDYDGKPVHRHLGAESIAYELEQSLKRLGTDHIDHYITHWQDPTTPIADTMEVLRKLKAQGKIRSIGASNLSSQDLAAYVAAGGLDAIQEEYSMVKRDIETTLLPVCRKHGVSTLSYSSLALGLLSGKIGPDRRFAGDDQRKDNPRFSTGNREKVARLMQDIAPVMDRHQATPAQIVIAWTIQQPGITFALCGARSPGQAIENAKAGRIRLSPNEIDMISEAATRHLTDLDA
jgi:methylglyoxal reductase